MKLTFCLPLCLAVLSHEAAARPHYYPGVRYISAASAAMGGVTLPIADEIGNALFNNPAALARNTKFKSEFLNLNLDANSGVLGGLGLSTLRMTSLGGMSTTLNENPNSLYTAGAANLTALSWGGFAVGLLLQEQVRAVSDGTTIQYDTVSQIIPAVGYGLSLARGVVRLGYSLQYISQSSGTATTAATNTTASFLEGINAGSGLSHTASVNFVFPFTYLPTFSVVARNIFGTHYSAGGFLTRAKNPVGIVPNEQMSVDAAFNYMIRISGKVKSYWYIQYKDLTSAYSMPVLERINFGIDLGLSPSFDLRTGFTGNQFSAGIGFRSKSSEINLSWYHEPSPFGTTEYWDTRYSLQYKVFFQDANTRSENTP